MCKRRENIFFFLSSSFDQKQESKVLNFLLYINSNELRFILTLCKYQRPVDDIACGVHFERK